MLKKSLPFLLACFVATALVAQSESFWKDIQPSQLRHAQDAWTAKPISFRSLELDFDALRNYLREAPMEFTPEAAQSPLPLTLPLPDGRNETFAVWESPIMEAGLAALFPQIKTYAGRSLLRPHVTLRFDQTPRGFHAIIHTPEGTTLIAPEVEGMTDLYLSFSLKDVDLAAHGELAAFCDLHDELPADETSLQQGSALRSTTVVDLRTYRLAVATTAEYSMANGGTVNSVMAAVTSVVNQVNSVFEKDNAVRLVLIDSVFKTFFFPPVGNDPFTNGNTSEMIKENPPVLNAAFGVNGYDVGHVFGTNGGGLANLGGVCNGSSTPPSPFPKARAASCMFGPYVGSLFYIVVGHEVGHQFNATHTFNKCDDENENPSTAYEPGSGSTIMCYNGNGVCGSNHLQAVTDDYFHINSMERIRNFTRLGPGSTCGQVLPIGNNTPETSLALNSGFYIPIGTPFQLEGSATDPEGDALTYVWEEYDLGPPSPLGMPVGTAPIFRSQIPSTSPRRVFPKMTTIIANASDPQELLPTYSRVLTFRFTARDNHLPAGAWSYSEITFNATADAGPFLVTSPNDATVSWEAGQFVEVTWDVANTDAAPVNCKMVDIRLSLDGGLTWPITLLSQTPNDGSAFVVVPDVTTTKARVRVDAADNIFFDISNEDFQITAPAQAGFSFAIDKESERVCLPEGFSFQVQTAPLLGFNDTIVIQIDGLPAGASFSLDHEPVLPGDTVVVSVDMSAVTASGDFSLSIMAASDTLPVQTRPLLLTVVSSDFSTIGIIGPDGEAGVSALPTLSWNGSPNAISYDIEIATSPDFSSSLVESASQITGTTYQPTATLSDNQAYYWRVRGVNECGSGPWTDPASFHTKTQVCETKQSTGGSINIPATGLPYIQSPINIPQNGTISELRVKNVKATHTAVAHVDLRLKGPDGDSVTLMSQLLCGSNQINLGFSDLAPPNPIPCPPNTGLLYKPAEPLAKFSGKNVQGNWTFVLAVVNTAGEGGTFQNWQLEYCAESIPNSPSVVRNDTLRVRPNDSRLIQSDVLEVTDVDNSPAELVFTVVRNVQFGLLTKAGNPIGTGGTFTMADVLNNQVMYTNTDTTATYDYFTFTVADGTGGFTGTPRFHIVMDPTAPSAVSRVQPNHGQLHIWPNPTGAALHIETADGRNTLKVVDIFDLQGRLVAHFALPKGEHHLLVDPTPWAEGLYLLRIVTDQGVYSSKIIVRHR